MAREHENYRLYLEQIYDYFGKLGQIPRKEVAKWLRMDERTVTKQGLARKEEGRYWVTTVELAQWLCRKEKK